MRLAYLFIGLAVFLELILVPYPVQSASIEAKKPIPEVFQFQGKPISPLCIAEIANDNSDKIISANLLKCSKNEKKYKIEPYKDAIDSGFTGFDYTLKNSSEEYVPTESAYYKYLGMFNNLHVIYFIYSGGGSGSFTSVFLVERKEDTIKYIKNVVSLGDRCNGGINSVSFKNNKLTYSVNISPYDFIDLSGIKIPKVKPYDDLATCAACCQGTAQFESDFEKSDLISLDLGETFENTQGTYQECFNVLLKDYKQQGKQLLSPAELKEFIGLFMSKCL